MSSSTALRLDALPLEIQQRIIAFTSLRTVLNITLVNRALHTVCESRAVFKGLIDNRNGHGGDVWQSPQFPGHTELDAWKRYALADDLTIKFEATSYKDDTSWVPQLIALRHPATDWLETSNPDLLNESSGLPPQDSADAFCQAVLAMSEVIEPEEMQAKGEWLAEFRSRFLEDFPGDMRWLDFESFFNLCVGREQPPNAIWAYHALELFYPALRHTVKAGLPTSSWDGLRRSSSPPSSPPPVVPFVKEIPFHEIMDLPLPFSDKAVDRFQWCHMPIMTSKAFVEDGDWIGCYTIESRHADTELEMQFDPPVHSIKLTMGERHPEKPLLYLSGEGKDWRGAFFLKGAVNTETAMTALVKSYAEEGAPIWNNIGILTPFGIFTSWGENHWGGWALLWKTSWCSDDDAAARSDDEDDVESYVVT